MHYIFRVTKPRSQRRCPIRFIESVRLNEPVKKRFTYSVESPRRVTKRLHGLFNVFLSVKIQQQHILLI